MRVLVLGGTRFIGPHVVRLLAEQGHEVTVLHRGLSEAELPPAVRHIHADRSRLPEMRTVLREAGPEVVLDMRPISERDALTVLDAFRGITERVVAVSSADVYLAYGILIGIEDGDLVPTPLTEDSPLRSRLYPYRGESPRAADDPAAWQDGYDKIPVERAVMSDAEIRGTVLRLPMVYGPGDGQHRLFQYLRRMDDQRQAVILGESRAAWRSPHGYVENVAAAIALAVTDNRAAGRVYNVAEPEHLTEAEWVRRIGEAAGWHGKLVVVPDAELPAHLAAGERLEQDLTLDSSRIRIELGYTEPLPPDEAMRRAVGWERRHQPAYDPSTFDYTAEDALLATLADTKLAASLP